MAKRRKAQRMFSRDERRAATQARAAAPPLSQQQQDELATVGYFGSDGRKCAASPTLVAEAWCALQDELDRTPEETQTMLAMQRHFKHLTGYELSRDLAEDMIAGVDVEPETYR